MELMDTCKLIMMRKTWLTSMIQQKDTESQMVKWVKKLLDHSMNHKEMILKELCFNSYLTMILMCRKNWSREIINTKLFASFHSQTKIRWRLLLEPSHHNMNKMMTQKFMLSSKDNQNSSTWTAPRLTTLTLKMKCSVDNKREIQWLLLKKWPRKDLSPSLMDTKKWDSVIWNSWWTNTKLNPMSSRSNSSLTWTTFAHLDLKTQLDITSQQMLAWSSTALKNQLKALRRVKRTQLMLEWSQEITQRHANSLPYKLESSMNMKLKAPKLLWLVNNSERKSDMPKIKKVDSKSKTILLIHKTTMSISMISQYSKKLPNMLELLLELLMKTNCFSLKELNKEVESHFAQEITLLMQELSKLLELVLPWVLLALLPKKTLI